MFLRSLFGGLLDVAQGSDLFLNDSCRYCAPRGFGSHHSDEGVQNRINNLKASFKVSMLSPLH